MKTLQIIDLIASAKRDSRVHPSHALECEVLLLYPEAKDELPILERDGKIKFGETINSRYITVL